MPTLGIDIGGTSVKAAMLRDPDVFTTARSARYDRPDRRAIVAAVAEAARLVLDGHSPKKLDAVGVCCPGLLDRQSKTITLSVNVPGLVGNPLDAMVAEALDVRAAPGLAILSDANAVAYDVYAVEQFRGRLLCLSLGAGVGASVIDDFGGAPAFLHVSGESPGHFGQLDVSLSADAPLGPDGGRGSLEAYVGAAALMARYGTPDVAERLTVNDEPIRALVRAIRIGHAMYRPHHVCLAGGIGQRLAPIAEQIQSAVGDRLTSVARENWRLTCATSDYHAACGAARHARAHQSH